MTRLWRDRLGGLVGGGSIMRSLMLRTKLKHQTKSSTDVVKEVQDAEDIAKLAYWQQGDASFYTAEMMERRAALRESKDVRDILQIWWETAIASDGNNSVRAKPGADIALSKAGYLSVMRKLYKVMVETGEYDDEEARVCAEEDYERDLQGSPEMTRTLFQSALFELADLWVDSVNARDYHDFLNSLIHAVATPVAGTNRFKWKSDNSIVYDAEYEAWGEGNGEETIPGAESGEKHTRLSYSRAARLSQVSSTGQRPSFALASRRYSIDTSAAGRSRVASDQSSGTGPGGFGFGRSLDAAIDDSRRDSTRSSRQSIDDHNARASRNSLVARMSRVSISEALQKIAGKRIVKAMTRFHRSKGGPKVKRPKSTVKKQRPRYMDWYNSPRPQTSLPEVTASQPSRPITPASRPVSKPSSKRPSFFSRLAMSSAPPRVGVLTAPSPRRMPPPHTPRVGFDTAKVNMGPTGDMGAVGGFTMRVAMPVAPPRVAPMTPVRGPQLGPPSDMSAFGGTHLRVAR